MGCFTNELIGKVRVVLNSSFWLGIRYGLGSVVPSMIGRFIVVKFGERTVKLSLGSFWQYL